jgi:acyl-CoA synthetase (AMP-forming)/AMP-acid ligase II
MGLPKLLLTHCNRLAGASPVAEWHELTPQDRCIRSLPIYHINGQVIGTLTPFASGGSIVARQRIAVE